MATPVQETKTTEQPQANTAQEQQAESIKKSGVDSQIAKSFEALSSEQKKLAGSKDDFSGAVQSQMQRVDETGQNLGITEEAAIGNVITELDKKVTPSTVMGTDKAEKFVGDTQAELDRLDQQERDFQPQTPPPSQIQDTGEDPEIAQANAQIDEEFNQVFNLLEERKATLDTRAQEQVDAITQEFAKRREQLRIFNQNRMKGLSILGARSGRQRFAGEIQSGIMSAEEAAGIQRFKDLAREEFLARQGIRQAQEDNNFNLMLQQVGLMREKRAAKQEALDRLQQAQAARQQQINEQNKQQLQFQKFLLDVEKFNQEIDNNNFDRALKVAEQSGRSVELDQNGNLVISDNLTFENQLKFDEFQLKAENSSIDNAYKEAKLELEKQGYLLNEAKFYQDVEEFGVDAAIKQENLRLKQQEVAIKRQEAGLPTTYDEMGISAPMADIANEVGGVITSIDTSELGDTGPIRKSLGQKGWECAAFAQQIVDLGTPNNLMGNTLQEKIQTVQSYGLTREEVISNGGYAIGDVIVSDGSDVSASGDPLQWGHVAIVVGQDESGNLILHEANRDGDGQITSGRTIDPNSSSIVGVLGRQNEKTVGNAGLKDKYLSQAKEKAGDNIINSFNSMATETLVNNGVINEKEGAAFTGAINSLGIFLPEKQGDAAKSEMNRLLRNGNVQAAKELVESSAIAAAPTAQKDKAQGRKEAITSLNVIQDLLDQYESQGGQTGIFTGSMQSIQNKIGEVGDPDLVNIATQIRLAIIDYRKAVSGAAFTESEGAEYEAIFPSVGKVSEFNRANINALMETFDRNHTVFMEQYIGAENYKNLFGEQDENKYAIDNSSGLNQFTQ
jgi:hypothetical protein